SVNWTPTSLDENREVAVAVRSRTLADYFRRVAAADRRDPGDRSVPPLLAVVGVAVAALAALLVGRRVEFADVGN
ncbi:MAG: phospholipase, partial [Halobaculum sp.]